MGEIRGLGLGEAQVALPWTSGLVAKYWLSSRTYKLLSHVLVCRSFGVLCDSLTSEEIREESSLLKSKFKSEYFQIPKVFRNSILKSRILFQNSQLIVFPRLYSRLTLASH